jgi:hypothetical protein
MSRHQVPRLGDRTSWYLKFLGRGHSLRSAAMPQMTQQSTDLNQGLPVRHMRGSQVFKDDYFGTPAMMLGRSRP